MRLQVHVTQDDIDAGVTTNVNKCPVALAVLAHAPKGAKVWVGGVVSIRITGWHVVYRESRRLATFIRRFDRGEKVEPAAFSLTKIR